MKQGETSGANVDRKPRRFIKGSRITWRILAINSFALFVLVLGLLYVGKYRQGLVEKEIVSLMTQARMFAAALGEGAVIDKYNQEQSLEKELCDQIIYRLVTATRTHAQLFSKNNHIITDSKLLAEPGGVVQVEELPPPAERNTITRYLLNYFDQLILLLTFDENITSTDYPNSGRILSNNKPEIQRTLRGNYGYSVKLDNATLKSVTVAVPVQRYKQILGALVLTKDIRDINEAVFEVRFEILKIFCVALIITVLLSIYLARTIAQPIHKLATTANSISQGLSRQYNIPDLSGRTDEIGYLSIALKDMTEELWSRMDSVEQFAADVAHEIKNPLTSIKSAVETAVMVKDSTHQQKLLSIILDDIQRLDRLITDIADASRLDAELSRAKVKNIDLVPLISTFRDLYQATVSSNGVKVCLTISTTEPIIISGIEDRIVQVLRNLVDNAESFSPTDGEINVIAEKSDKVVTITVNDEGPGIQSNSLNYIFDRFYQDRPPGEKFGAHSGLGLNISKQIIETHGGNIWAENRLSPTGSILGARISFSLPLTNIK